MQRSYSCTAWHSENSAVQLYAPRRPRIMHVEFFVKIPTEIYPCMIHAHKMASAIGGIVPPPLTAPFTQQTLQGRRSRRAALVELLVEEY